MRLHTFVMMAVFTAALVSACSSDSEDAPPTPSPTAASAPTGVPSTPPTPASSVNLTLTRGSLHEEAPFAGIFVLDLEERTWLHIDEDPSQAPAPVPRLLATSPDGQLIAISTSAGDVRVLTIDGREVRRWPDLGGFSGTFSPNGRYLALAQSGNAVALDLETGLIIDAGLDMGAWSADWAPDGATLLFGTGGGRGPLVDGEIYLFDVAARRLSLLAIGLYPGWSADGGQIAFVQDGALKVVSASGDPLFSWEPADSSFTLTGLRWSPDGETLVANTMTLLDDPRLIAVAVLDAADGTLQFTLTGAGSMRLSPDGRQFATFGNACSPEPGFFLFQQDGSGLRRLEGISSPGPWVWSPDGQAILVSQRTQLVEIPPSGGDPRTVFEGPSLIRGLHWSDQGTVTFDAVSVAGFCEGIAPQTSKITFPDQDE